MKKKEGGICSFFLSLCRGRSRDGEMGTSQDGLSQLSAETVRAVMLSFYGPMSESYYSQGV